LTAADRLRVNGKSGVVVGASGADAGGGSGTMYAVRKAFTLVEILIVVIILGILAAIVVPQFANATEQATSTGTYDQLTKVREAVAVYYVRNGNDWPQIQAGVGTWGQVIGPGYMREVPVNLWVGNNTAGRTIIFRDTPDTGFQTSYGWIFDPATGNIWAGSYDAQDQPFPRP
jgi:general secretion pathway protein G